MHDHPSDLSLPTGAAAKGPDPGVGAPDAPNLPLSAAYDPWDPFLSWRPPDGLRLTSIEVTVTTRCNLRCQHCAVGDQLVRAEPPLLPLDVLTRRMDEVEQLLTFSITGGEPLYDPALVEPYIVPLLAYAKRRGARTQINSNLTLPLDRYLPMLPYLDVLHISWNYLGPEDFGAITFAKAGHAPAPGVAQRLYRRMVDNIAALTARDVFVAAETILFGHTLPHMGRINRMLAGMGCRRHEVHPLYPSDFARDMTIPSLDAVRTGVERLLDERDRSLWVLFGTFPFLACSPNPADRALVHRVWQEPSVSIRNDPDGRCRLNINALNGDVVVADFGDVPPLGNLRTGSLPELHRRWQAHPQFVPFNCFCPGARCTGPNLLVAHTYDAGADYQQRRALIEVAS